MTSYHGENTSKMMDDMRRQTKRKQSKGTGIDRGGPAPIDHKEVAKFVPRHHTGLVTPDFAKSIDYWSMDEETEGRSGVPCLRNLRYWADNGLPKADAPKGEFQKWTIILTGLNAKAIGLEGKIVRLTPEGFVMEDGSKPPMDIWSITFCLREGDRFGVQAKWDDKARQMILL